LKIEDTTNTYYNYDKYGCSILVQGDFEGRFKVVDYDKNLLVLNPGGIVYMLKNPAFPNLVKIGYQHYYGGSLSLFGNHYGQWLKRCN